MIHTSRPTTTTTTYSQLHMALVPLAVDELERLISSSGKPTGVQYATYWGRTKKERYGRLVESATVGFLGVFFSYFLSFVLGGFVATILGSLFFFWGVLSPELKAYQRNWEFLGGRSLVDLETVLERGWDPETAGLYGGLFLGRVADVCVVEDAQDTTEYDLADFADYTMETDELDRFTGQPYLLRVQCADRQGRTLQIHCRLSEEYLDLQPGRPATTLLLSTTPKFTKLAALTDVYVLPAPLQQQQPSRLDGRSYEDEEDTAGCWIGDYPYLDRAELEALLAEDDDLWDALQQEAAEPLNQGDAGYYDSAFGQRTRADVEPTGNTNHEDDNDDDGFENTGDDDSIYDDDDALVPARRRRSRRKF